MTFWTDEHVEKLRKLWADGLSCSQIAEAMGAESRNAVIGKVHRLGLTDRKRKQATPRPRPARPATPKPPPRAPLAPRAPTFRSEPVPVDMTPAPAPKQSGKAGLKTLLDLLRGDCRWPIGDPRNADFRFCAEPREHAEGGPYCAAHHQESISAYSAAEQRRTRRVAMATVAREKRGDRNYGTT